MAAQGADVMATAARATGGGELCRRSSSPVVVLVGGARVLLRGALVPARLGVPVPGAWAAHAAGNHAVAGILGQ